MAGYSAAACFINLLFRYDPPAFARLLLCNISVVVLLLLLRAVCVRLRYPFPSHLTSIGNDETIHKKKKKKKKKER